MTTSTLTVTDFVLARIAEDEARARDFEEHYARSVNGDYGTGGGQWATPMWFGAEKIGFTPARVLAQCAAMRKIVELHKSWPVLVQTPPEFTHDERDLTTMTMRMSQQIAWTTEQEYRNRFGDEPPTAPMVAALASIWSDHPEFRDEWRA